MTGALVSLFSPLLTQLQKNDSKDDDGNTLNFKCSLHALDTFNDEFVPIGMFLANVRRSGRHVFNHNTFSKTWMIKWEALTNNPSSDIHARRFGDSSSLPLASELGQFIRVDSVALQPIVTQTHIGVHVETLKLTLNDASIPDQSPTCNSRRVVHPMCQLSAKGLGIKALKWATGSHSLLSSSASNLIIVIVL